MTQTLWSRAAWRAQFQPTPGSEPRWGSQANAVIRTFNRGLVESRVKSAVLVPDLGVCTKNVAKLRNVSGSGHLENAVGFLPGGAQTVPVLDASPLPEV